MKNTSQAVISLLREKAKCYTTAADSLENAERLDLKLEKALSDMDSSTTESPRKRAWNRRKSEGAV